MLQTYKASLRVSTRGFPELKIRIVSDVDKQRVAFFQLVQTSEDVLKLLGTKRKERRVTPGCFVDTVWDLNHPHFKEVYPFYNVHQKYFLDSPYRTKRFASVKWLAHCYAVEIDPTTRQVLKPIVGFSWGFHLNQEKIRKVPLRVLSSVRTWNRDLQLFLKVHKVVGQ